MTSDKAFDLFMSDLRSLKEELQEKAFAYEVYAALCNNSWVKGDNEFSVSWRTAGWVLAELRDLGEDYLDFYCSGDESVVTERVQKALTALGWSLKE